MGTTVEARVSRQMQRTAADVYDAWLDPPQVRLWMVAALKAMSLPGDIREIVIDPHAGGKFLFSDQRDDVEARHWGAYLELDRPTRIAFTWIVDESEEADPSVVSIRIEPQAQGCCATITHQIDAAWADHIPKVEQAWSNMLTAIDTCCERLD